ncbi:hypothetical protein ACJX0J_022409, partial [Zea mays]
WADRRFDQQKVMCVEFMGKMRAVSIFCNFMVLCTLKWTEGVDCQEEKGQTVIS